MDNHELSQKITDWFRAEAEWDLQDGGAGANSLLTLTSTNQAQPAIAIEMRRSVGEDRITAEHSLKIPKNDVDGSTTRQHSVNLEKIVERLIDGRAALLSGTTQSNTKDYEINISSTIYLDGLSKHVFFSAVDELIKTRRVIERAAEDVLEQGKMLAQLEASIVKAGVDAKRVMEKAERAIAGTTPTPKLKPEPQKPQKPATLPE